MAAKRHYALVSFRHHEHDIKAGDKYELHHPMVEARPDLFTTEPPPKPAKAVEQKEV